jgi:AAA+ ATPase superfamily predicted ATPase
MKKLEKNPFKFGDPVEGHYYLSRPELKRAVANFLENQIHVVLIGPRRFGKTSFTLNLLKELEKRSYFSLFVDIFNITSHRDFLHQLLRALNAKENLKTRMKKWGKAILGMRPKLSADFDLTANRSSVGLSLEPSSETDVKEMIQNLLNDLEKVSHKTVIAIDEFQQVAELEDQGWLEATLRTHMQQSKKVSFLFTGSRRSIIYDMLNNHSRPFYRSCQPIEFPSFGEEFTDWVMERFIETGIECHREAIQHLRQLVQETPNYVQMVCFHLVAEGRRSITIKAVEEALETVVRQNTYTYQTLLNSLTPIQQRILRLTARHGKEIYSQDLLKEYEISSAPAMASAIKALKKKGIIDEEGTGRGTVVFDDPLFAIWLRIFNVS